ncbi:aconitate hydratase [Vibrio harveyi]|uniref:aconitate hydratase n=1 Tax=Vibrio harveyi TaxID=669 RepID=UPI00069DADE0|nr:aconitate hydratase AcnA [Vibrio harveyi]
MNASTDYLSRITLSSGTYEFVDVPAFVRDAGMEVTALPLTCRYLLEYLLSHDQRSTAQALLHSMSGQGIATSVELSFAPTRLVMQDYTAVPALVDMASIRDQVAQQGGRADSVKSELPVHVVIDHSVLIDQAMNADAQSVNEANEIERNRERYRFLKWCEDHLGDITLVPPGNGIVHQLNMERFANLLQPIGIKDGCCSVRLDSVLGTDSHTTMINGLGILGWGIGGLEATSIMMGKASQWRMSDVVGVHVKGRLSERVNATDVALTLAELLRQSDVNGCFVEFFGDGISQLSAQDRCTIANMAPEFGVKTALFPVDREVLNFFAMTKSTDLDINSIETILNRMGIYTDETIPSEQLTSTPHYRRVIELDLSQVQTTLAGPNFPHRRYEIRQTDAQLPSPKTANATLPELAVVIAALTSCTNTANPSLMVQAALLARNAVNRGLQVPWFVKTTFSPGSRAVTDYLQRAGLLAPLEALGFFVVGYGCMTCNGGGGDLVPGVIEVRETKAGQLASVTSGNRNFAGRIHPDVDHNILASPAMVVAYALAGSARFDVQSQPLGSDAQNRAIYLAEIWPSDTEVSQLLAEHVGQQSHQLPLIASSAWQTIDAPNDDLYPWEIDSTYLTSTLYPAEPEALPARIECRPLLILQDDVTTDDISPVGKIAPSSEAGRFLMARGESASTLNTFGSRRGHFEVMLRGAFSNPLLPKQLWQPTKGSINTESSVFMLAQEMQLDRLSSIIVAGRHYGMGSSRDWAAKATSLLGVRVVLAESFERIHCFNLIAMSVLPLEFQPGDDRQSLGVTPQSVLTITPYPENQSGFTVNGQAKVVCVQRDTQVATSLIVNLKVSTQDELSLLNSGGAIGQLIQMKVNDVE